MKHNFKDRTGIKFGRLTAMRYAGNCQWECKCDCGEVKVVRTEHLTDPKGTRSCGCLRSELNSRRQTLLKTRHGLHKSSEYNIWSAMRQRCSNPKHKEWLNYGGRGVRVCPEWGDFATFYADMGPRPSTAHSLDRKDNGLLYSKETCRWATGIEQHNNTRRNRLLVIHGRTQTVAQWAREVGLSYSTVMNRLQHNWTPEESIA